MDERREEEQTQSVQFDFSTILAGVRNYDDIQKAIKRAADDFKQKGVAKIGFVSGRIGRPDADPAVRKQTMREDMENMRELTQQLYEEHGYPIISSANIFGVVKWDDLEESSLPREEISRRMKLMFRKILKNGVTDIFMKEGWREAPGAIDEHDLSEEIGIEIHDLEPQRGLTDRTERYTI